MILSHTIFWRFWTTFRRKRVEQSTEHIIVYIICAETAIFRIGWISGFENLFETGIQNLETSLINFRTEWMEKKWNPKDSISVMNKDTSRGMVRYLWISFSDLITVFQNSFQDWSLFISFSSFVMYSFVIDTATSFPSTIVECTHQFAFRTMISPK